MIGSERPRFPRIILLMIKTVHMAQPATLAKTLSDREHQTTHRFSLCTFPFLCEKSHERMNSTAYGSLFTYLHTYVYNFRLTHRKQFLSTKKHCFGKRTCVQHVQRVAGQKSSCSFVFPGLKDLTIMFACSRARLTQVILSLPLSLSSFSHFYSFFF